ncbi:unnamed protein product, partial [marine sediment metagenome]
DNVYTFNVTPAGQGAVTVDIDAGVAQDAAGNPNTAAAQFSITFDNLTPTAPSLVTPENEALLNNLAVSFTWTEPESGVTYHIQIDNEASFTAPYVHENTAVTDNSHPYTFGDDGIYYWRVSAVDVAMNEGQFSDNFKLTLDTAAPTVPLLVSPADGLDTSDNNIPFDWSDADGGLTPILKYEVEINGTPENTTDNTSSLVASEFPEGSYTWRVRAYDNAGNVSAYCTSWEFTIDKTAPTVPSLVSPADGLDTNDSSQALDWSDSDGGLTNFIRFLRHEVMEERFWTVQIDARNGRILTCKMQP